MTSTSDNKQRLLDLYTSFINSFDGSPTAFATAEPILGQLFDPSFLIVTGDGTKDLKWYTAFAKSFAESGNVAKVTSIASINDQECLSPAQFQVTIENTVGGVVIDPIVFRGTAVMDKNGEYKITYMKNVEQMLSLWTSALRSFLLRCIGRTMTLLA